MHSTVRALMRYRGLNPVDLRNQLSATPVRVRGRDGKVRSVEEEEDDDVEDEELKEGWYEVHPGLRTCTCPDTSKLCCKHIHAATETLRKLDTTNYRYLNYHPLALRQRLQSLTGRDIEDDAVLQALDAEDDLRGDAPLATMPR